MSRGLRTALGTAAVLLLTFAVWKLPSTGLISPLLFWNTGQSMPTGLYVWRPGVEPTKGAVVVVRDPPHFRLTWLIKRVEGVAGDRYCWDERLGTQTLNGRPMPPPWPEAITMGVPVWTGCHVLAGDEIVGYGDSTDSYDARYFGPVHTDQLYGIYVHVF